MVHVQLKIYSDLRKRLLKGQENRNKDDTNSTQYVECGVCDNGSTQLYLCIVVKTISHITITWKHGIAV
jgi:hypothetical protein